MSAIQLDHVPSLVNAGIHVCNKKVSAHSSNTVCLFTKLFSVQQLSSECVTRQCLLWFRTSRQTERRYQTFCPKSVRHLYPRLFFSPDVLVTNIIQKTGYTEKCFVILPSPSHSSCWNTFKHIIQN